VCRGQQVRVRVRDGSREQGEDRVDHLRHTVATTRIGWVIGMLDLVHAWVEVVDADGVSKVVDPIFTLFAGTIPNANPDLLSTTHTMRTNRLIPTALRVGDRVATHPCDRARFTTKIQPAKEPR
jgi:hypothetical protein